MEQNYGSIEERVAGLFTTGARLQSWLDVEAALARCQARLGIIPRDVADQIIFMDGGVIVEQGDPHQVIEHPREERTRQFLARYSEN